MGTEALGYVWHREERREATSAKLTVGLMTWWVPAAKRSRNAASSQCAVNSNGSVLTLPFSGKDFGGGAGHEDVVGSGVPF